MSLLFSNEIKEKLSYELINTKSCLHIVSAYCKVSAIKFVQENIAESITDKKLLVRFAFNDLISGASDLEVYNFCRENGWQMFVRFDLHAKTYIFDKIRCIIGSANLTSNGIGLHSNHNFEIAQLTTLEDDEMNKIELLFDSAVLMTDELYMLMQNDLNARTMGDIQFDDDWNSDILVKFRQKVNVLFTYELPNCNSLSNLKYDSLDFLGLSSGWDINKIKKAFEHSNVYLWLIDKLEHLPDNEIYFGALSAELHNAIINDPKPYRKDVKELQANLLNWIIELEIKQIKIDRPNHSQRVRLIKTN